MSEDTSTATTDGTTAPPGMAPAPAGVPPLPPGAVLRPGAPPLPAGMPPLPEPAPAPPLPGASTAPVPPPVEPEPPRTKGPSWNQGDFGVWLPGEQPAAAASAGTTTATAPMPPGPGATATTATAPGTTAPGTTVVDPPAPAPQSARRSSVPKRLQVHSVELAMPWRRIVARIIDGIICAVVFTAPVFLLGTTVTGEGQPAAGPSLTTMLVIIGLALFGPALYEIIGIAVWGRTIGKWILGIRVVDARDGDIPGWSMSTMRWVPTLVAVIPLIGGLLSLILGIWSLVNLWANTKRQTPFDLFAGTVVIREP